MDAERETEIRALAARFMAGTKHRRVGQVLLDLLAEIDLLRGEDDEPHMTWEEAMDALVRWADRCEPVVGRGAEGWSAAVRSKIDAYASIHDLRS